MVGLWGARWLNGSHLATGQPLVRSTAMRYIPIIHILGQHCSVADDLGAFKNQGISSHIVDLEKPNPGVFRVSIQYKIRHLIVTSRKVSK